MTKELIQEFSQIHAEPTWLTDLRQQAFDQCARFYGSRR